MEDIIYGVYIAVGGWLIAHFSKLHFEKRAGQLARMSDQLEKLYGPLNIE